MSIDPYDDESLFGFESFNSSDDGLEKTEDEFLSPDSEDNEHCEYLPMEGHASMLVSTILAGGDRSFEIKLRNPRHCKEPGWTLRVRAPNRTYAEIEACRRAQWLGNSSAAMEILSVVALPQRMLWAVYLVGRPHCLPRSPVTGTHCIGYVVATDEARAVEAAYENHGVSEAQWPLCDPLRSIGRLDAIEVCRV